MLLQVNIGNHGYVEAKYRPFAHWHWERKDGGIIKPSHPVLELFEYGVGKTPETALKVLPAVLF